MPTKLGRDELVEDLQRVAEEIGEQPSASQYREHGRVSPKTVQNRFGSWNAGLEAAGFEGREQFADPGREAELMGAECANCGTQERVRKSQNKNQKRWYCSRACKAEWLSENQIGEDHHQYDQVEVECDNCEEEFNRKPSVAEKRDLHFCSRSCMGEWYSNNKAGEKSHMWEGGEVEVECEVCGEGYHVKPAEEAETRFCSRECLAAARIDEYSGESNPNWAGGYEPYYGANWREMRRERLKHDGFECVVCGIGQAEHIEEYDSGLHVHHVIPHREFENSEDANQLENLRTMCTTHHKQWEGVPVAPD